MNVLQIVKNCKFENRLTVNFIIIQIIWVYIMLIPINYIIELQLIGLEL